ncbi:MAG: bifunctional diaminohydroxyphosphoribosylaminopyrimidine deaminase/5-amino-6-(5-phosphoribosylamino)uracil reductase RibD [Bacteroidota bacterium]
MIHMSSKDEYFMARCLALAARGRGSVSPNPMVGAVIVRNGNVLGEGFHERFGGIHAEVSAIKAAHGDVRGATLYVNLEPCSHWGKTPPCTDLIISSQIARVVVAMKDPNPLVAGKGIRKLAKAGIAVEVGVLEDEARRLNEAYIYFVLRQRPFVALKIAQSLDGDIAAADGSSHWITSKQARTFVHELRSVYDAVLIGARTVALDNPSLTVRFVNGRTPKRVILDGALSISLDTTVVSDRYRERTIIVTSKDALRRRARKASLLERRGVALIGVKGNSAGHIPLDRVLAALGELGIASVLVEGGATIFSEFMQSHLAQKLYLFQAPILLGNGRRWSTDIRALEEALKIRNVQVRMIGPDLLIEGYLE